MDNKEIEKIIKRAISGFQKSQTPHEKENAIKNASSEIVRLFDESLPISEGAISDEEINKEAFRWKSEGINKHCGPSNSFRSGAKWMRSKVSSEGSDDFFDLVKKLEVIRDNTYKYPNSESWMKSYYNNIKKAGIIFKTENQKSKKDE